MTGDVSQEEEFDNGTLETCLVSNGVRAQKHGEGLLLELHVRQAADLVYQAMMTTTSSMTSFPMLGGTNRLGWREWRLRRCACQLLWAPVDVG